MPFRNVGYSGLIGYTILSKLNEKLLRDITSVKKSTRLENKYQTKSNRLQYLVSSQSIKVAVKWILR